MPYIGKSPSQATRKRYYKTASGSETSISGTMTVGGTLTFTDGEFVDVSVNGVALVAGTDYNTDTANTIAGLSALSANDQVEIVVYDTFSVFSGDVDSNMSVGGNLSVTGTTALTGNATAAGTLGVTGVVTANAGVVVDNITIDGTEIDLSSGDLTLDVANDIILDADGGNWRFKDAGTSVLTVSRDSDTSVNLFSAISDADIKFQGNDGGSTITALTLDMSLAGTAIFNHDIEMPDSGLLRMGAGGDLILTSDGTNGTIFTNNGNLTADAAGELIIDVDLQGEGNGILLKDDGTLYGNIFRTSSDLVIMSSASDEDLIFKGNDGGSTITALTLDMSDAGKASFNAGASFANGCTIVGGDFGTLLLDNADASHGTQLLFQHNSTVNTGADIQMSDAGGLKIRTLAVEPITLHVAASAGSPQEVIRFHTTKKISYGRTSTIAGSHFAFEYNSNDGVGINLSSTDATGNAHNQIVFTRNDSTVGTISTNGSNTTYGTNSDYRLKENVAYTWDATSRLKQLKPARFNFIADADTTVDGFLAHEVSSIVPESVVGTKDETRNVTNAVLSSSGKVLDEDITKDEWTAGKLTTTDSDGNTVDALYPSNSTWATSHTEPVMQNIDQSKLVPLLVKSLQEAVIKIETLEAKVAALEAE